MARTKKPAPVRFLDISFANPYGQKEVLVHVSCDLPGESMTYRESSYRTSRPKGVFSGVALEDLRLSCYVGHFHGYGSDDLTPPDRLWGWKHEFRPSRIQYPAEATRILRTLQAIERRDDRLRHNLSLGDPSTFAGYLQRMAAILGATEIRIWLPRDGAIQSYLSDPLGLAEGAEIVTTIAEAWGRSQYPHLDAATVKANLPSLALAS